VRIELWRSVIEGRMPIAVASKRDAAQAGKIELSGTLRDAVYSYVAKRCIFVREHDLYSFGVFLEGYSELYEAVTARLPGGVSPIAFRVARWTLDAYASIVSAISGMVGEQDW
jgi:hypothetical protein